MSEEDIAEFTMCSKRNTIQIHESRIHQDISRKIIQFLNSQIKSIMGSRCLQYNTRTSNRLHFRELLRPAIMYQQVFISVLFTIWKPPFNGYMHHFLNESALFLRLRCKLTVWYSNILIKYEFSKYDAEGGRAQIRLAQDMNICYSRIIIRTTVAVIRQYYNLSTTTGDPPEKLPRMVVLRANHK